MLFIKKIDVPHSRVYLGKLFLEVSRDYKLCKKVKNFKSIYTILHPFINGSIFCYVSKMQVSTSTIDDVEQ